MFSGLFSNRTSGKVHDGDTIKCTVDGVTYTATIHCDDYAGKPEDNDEGFWPSLDRSAPGWIGDNPRKSYAQQMADCEAVMAMHRAGEMIYCAVAVTAEKGGFQLLDDYECALWGVDVNWPHGDNSYLVTLANEFLPEAQSAAAVAIKKKIASAQDTLAVLTA
jgi:hypothetical protein